MSVIGRIRRMCGVELVREAERALAELERVGNREYVEREARRLNAGQTVEEAEEERLPTTRCQNRIMLTDDPSDIAGYGQAAIVSATTCGVAMGSWQ